MTTSYNQARAVSKAAGYYVYVCPYTKLWIIKHNVAGFSYPRIGYQTERAAWMAAHNALKQTLEVHRGIKI